MAELALQTHNLTKKYGSFLALDAVSLKLEKGEIYGLIGRNGAGKTTFFKCVMGLAKANEGSIVINGEESRLGPSRAQMGFMINPSFFSYLNPKENLEYLCRVKGLSAKTEVDRLLKMVELDGIKKPFKAFSMGMKQRLGIAGALLGSPSIVVLDEPINGLDPQGIIDMRELIRNVHRQTGTTFIVSSHILSELDLVATVFGFIDHGVLLKEITHEDLHEQTRKTLIIESSDPLKAQALLHSLGFQDAALRGKQLVVGSGLERSHEVARALINEGLEIFDLHRQETTLEEYFMSLVGGGQDA